MEAREGPAGDDQRDRGPEGRGLAAQQDRREGGERRRLHPLEGHYGGDKADGDAEVEQKRVQVVPRLQQEVHRDGRRDDDVDELDHHPRLVAQGNRELGPHPDGDDHQDDPDDRGHRQVHFQSVDQNPQDDGGEGHEDRGRPDGGRPGEHGADDVGEGRHDEDQQEEDDPVERLSRALRDEVRGHELHRLGVVADRGHERQVVVDGADEDVSEPDPEKPREPAPDHGHGRPDQRPRAGDGREVVTEEDRLVGRDVVHAVVEALRGRRVLVVGLDDVLFDLLAVRPVQHHVDDETDDDDDCG